MVYLKVEDASYSLSWNKELCSWSITGQGVLKPTLTKAQQQIIDLLESEERSWTTGEIAEQLNKRKSAMSNLLKRLQEIGHIESPHYGQYRLNSSFMVSYSSRERESVKVPQGPIAHPS